MWCPGYRAIVPPLFPHSRHFEICSHQNVPCTLGRGDNHLAPDPGCLASGPNSPTENVSRILESKLPNVNDFFSWMRNTSFVNTTGQRRPVASHKCSSAAQYTAALVVAPFPGNELVTCLSNSTKNTVGISFSNTRHDCEFPGSWGASSFYSMLARFDSGVPW